MNRHTLAALLLLAPALAFAGEAAPNPAAAAETDAPAARERTEREITLDECIRLALLNNLDLQIKRLDRQSADLDLASARGAYDPSLSLAASRSHTETSGQSAGTAEGVLATAASDQDEDAFSGGLSGKTSFYGLSYALTAKTGRTEGSRASNPFDTANASVGASLTQPLLAGFKTDSARWQLASARSLSESAALSLERQAQTTVAAVVSAWYDFISARESIAVHAEAVRLAEQLLADSVRKVQVGALSPLDEKQASSQAASARAALADARRSCIQAENALKNLVFADLRAARAVALSPIGDLSADEVRPDLDLSSEAALENRPDLRAKRLEVERLGLAADFNKNKTLPALDFVAGAGLAASDGDDYGDAWDRISSADDPYWTVGLQFSVPLGNRTARSEYAKSLAALDSARLSLRALEESVLVDIDDSVAAVFTGWAKILATRDAREYAAQALAAEQKKLESGKSTNFVVLQLQKDLTSARQTEIAATAAYLKALSALALADASILTRFSLAPPAPNP